MLNVMRKNSKMQPPLSSHFSPEKKAIKKRFVQIPYLQKKCSGIMAFVFLMLIAVTIGTFVACQDKANGDPSDFDTDLIAWLKNTTNIPVYLPTEWNPIKKEQGKLKYFDVDGDANSYGFTVYKTSVPVKFNDNKDLIEKNEPVSEADVIGSLSGGKSEGTKSSFQIPKDAHSFELMKGITAYERDHGTEVWWKEKGWTFHYSGNFDYRDNLKALALAWLDIQVSEAGRVAIVGGNRYNFYYDWEHDGYDYSINLRIEDFKETIKILNSFTKIDLKKN